MKALLIPILTFGTACLAADPAVLEKGKAVYNAKCGQCHGDEGDGKGVGAEFFSPLPRDFTSGAFKVRTTESGELPTHADLKAIIRRGMPYTGMPPWPRLSEEEVDALVEYVKTFNADFADPASQAKPVAIPKAPAYSEGNLEAGRKLYEENKCLDCHGKLGRGDGESGPTLVDDLGIAIRPADLTKPWTFRGGATREDLYRTFTTGLNGTPMPSYAASISEGDRWKLVDYLMSLSPEGIAAPYATAVIGEAVPKVDLALGEKLFAESQGALFAVSGQVIENPRGYFPGVNAVEVRAVYDSTHVGLRVSWHDMNAQKEGSNSPAHRDTLNDSVFSDAVAVQIPLKPADGMAKPYFIFGDKKMPVELWFADLAAQGATLFTGKGSRNLAPAAGTLESHSEYTDGEWRVYFKRPRKPEKGMAIGTEEFIPIAFSVWDGFNKETGSKRGLTSWTGLYLKPPQKQSPFVPAATKGGAVLLAEILFLLLLRWQYRKGRIRSEST